MPLSLWWIRRDLRIQDNSALLAAQRSGNSVMPVFILDEKLMKSSAEPAAALFDFSPG